MKLRQAYRRLDFVLALVVWGVVESAVVMAVPAYAEVYEQFGGKLPISIRGVICFSRFPWSMAVPFVLAGLVVFQLWRVRCLPTSAPDDSPRRWDDKVIFAVILTGAALFVYGTWVLSVPLIGIGEIISNK